MIIKEPIGLSQHKYITQSTYHMILTKTTTKREIKKVLKKYRTKFYLTLGIVDILNTPNNTLYMPLVTAVINSRIYANKCVIQELINYKANVNYVCGKKSALFLACKYIDTTSKPSTITLLLDNGADVNLGKVKMNGLIYEYPLSCCIKYPELCTRIANMMKYKCLAECIITLPFFNQNNMVDCITFVKNIGKFGDKLWNIVLAKLVMYKPYESKIYNDKLLAEYIIHILNHIINNTDLVQICSIININKLQNIMMFPILIDIINLSILKQQQIISLIEKLGPKYVNKIIMFMCAFNISNDILKKYIDGFIIDYRVDNLLRKINPRCRCKNTLICMCVQNAINNAHTVMNNLKINYVASDLTYFMNSNKVEKFDPNIMEYLKFIVSSGIDLFDGCSNYRKRKMYIDKGIVIVHIFDICIRKIVDVINNDFVKYILDIISKNNNVLIIPMIIFENVHFINYIDIYNLVQYFVKSGHNIEHMMDSILIASIKVKYFNKILFKQLIQMCSNNKLLELAKIDRYYLEKYTNVILREKIINKIMNYIQIAIKAN